MKPIGMQPTGDWQVLCLDLDSTLAVPVASPSGRRRKGEGYTLLPGVEETLAGWEGVRKYIVTNQGGVAGGFTDLAECDQAVAQVAERLKLDGYRLCPFMDRAKNPLFETPHEALAEWGEKWGTPEAYALPVPFPEYPNVSFFRKPGDGMLYEVAEREGIAPERLLFVGDYITDQQTAESFGCEFRWADEFFDPAQKAERWRQRVTALIETYLLGTPELEGVDTPAVIADQLADIANISNIHAAAEQLFAFLTREHAGERAGLKTSHDSLDMGNLGWELASQVLSPRMVDYPHLIRRMRRRMGLQEYTKL